MGMVSVSVDLIVHSVMCSVVCSQIEGE